MGLSSLSIVIPTYDGLPHLQRCLAAVKRHALPGTQIVVVDDASCDGSTRWVSRHHADVELITLPQNQGFCHAANAGLAATRGQVVELLNNDTEVYPGWAEACLEHFGDPEVGSVAPLAVRMDETNKIDSCGQEYHACGWAYDRGHGRPVDAAAGYSREVFGPTGSCGFYRRSALEKTGFLWPIYGAYFEDTDLAFRLRRAGYRCVFEPASRVAHKGSATYGKTSDRVVWRLSRNEEIVFWANLPWKDLLLGLLPHVGFLAVRALRKAYSGQIGSYMSGKLDALRRGGDIRQRRRALRNLAGAKPLELGLRRSAAVLADGLRFMAHRKCA